MHTALQLRTQADGRTGAAAAPLALLLALPMVFTVLACDAPHLAAPEDPVLLVPAASLALAEYTYFSSEPPDPAYVGATYDVTAQLDPLTFIFNGGPWVWSETPAVCEMTEWVRLPEEPWGIGPYDRFEGTVTFISAGTCVLKATCDSSDCSRYTEEQVFAVVQPFTPGVPPVQPGTPPERGSPPIQGRPNNPGTPNGPGGRP